MNQKYYVILALSAVDGRTLCLGGGASKKAALQSVYGEGPIHKGHWFEEFDSLEDAREAYGENVQ